MSIIDVTYPAWQDRGACNDSTADFFPGIGHNATAAKAVCNKECPVRAACLSWALEMDVHDGVFGGLTPTERRLLAARPDTCPDCGSSSGLLG